MTVISHDYKIYTSVSKSIVKFKILSNKEIDDFILTDEWKNKAGAYAIQGYASSYIKFMSGSYSNIVGLPLYETSNLLNKIGLKKTAFKGT